MKIISVVGARPNFMKIASFIRAIADYNSDNPTETLDHILVHTGQHYDDRMSKSFFKSLNIPDADINLGIGSGTHAEQVGNTMIEFEKVLKKEQADWVVVVGDVNATMACSITAKKEGVKLCHIEAGLRSGDMSMPEEINRLVTDRLSDLLLIPDQLSAKNLKKEGVPEENIKFVGNIMIDTLEANREKASKLNVEDIIKDNSITQSPNHPITPSQSFALVTLHRPSNVDDSKILGPIVDFLLSVVSVNMPIIWTVHPRTQKKLKDFNLWDKIVQDQRIILLHPLGYHEMLKLNIESSLMLSDSGGLQSECAILNTPNLVLRDSTEWVITLEENGGNNILAGKEIVTILKNYQKILSNRNSTSRPELWDGKTATRCLEAILNH